MKRAGSRRVAGISIIGAMALTLAACGGDTAEDTTTGGDDTTTSEEGGELSGSIAGAGASSMENAMQGWLAGFQEANPGVTVNYDPVGSGAGREQFLQGATVFGGSDAYMDEEELAQGSERCFGGEVIELPLYISPIAVAFNLEGIDSLNMSPATIGGIFAGTITQWDDPAIAADNEGVELPDLAIVPVNRADDSGTTENFTEYLEAAAPEAWTHGAVETWPVSGTQSAQGTSGVVQLAQSTEGTIVYADASQIGELGTVSVGVGEEFVELSPEAAAQIVDVSDPAESATEKRLTIDLDRDTTESGTYPIVLISYTLACDTYDDAADAANVKGLLTYIASEEGQQRAAEPSVAGSAPISEDLRTRVMSAVDSITAN